MDHVNTPEQIGTFCSTNIFIACHAVCGHWKRGCRVCAPPSAIGDKSGQDNDEFPENGETGPEGGKTKVPRQQFLECERM